MFLYKLYGILGFEIGIMKTKTKRSAHEQIIAFQIQKTLSIKDGKL